MRRRDFMKAIAATATVWPLVGRAQQGQRMRRIGVLMNLAADDVEGQARLSAFVEALSDLGWKNASNVQIDICWGAGDSNLFHQCAAKLVGLAPDIILAASASTMDSLLNRTGNVPIVFAQVPDPVGSGYVRSLAHPGGNVTGFTQFDFSMAGKWIGLLKTIEPSLTRAIVLRDVDTTGAGQFGAIQTAAKSIGVEVSPTGVRNTSNIENAIMDFARFPKGGLVVTGSAPAAAHRELIITLAARHRLPAIYRSAISSIVAVSSPTDQRPLIPTYAQQVTLTASSGARNQAIFQFKHQPSTSSSSIRRPPRRSASTCHGHSSPAPTR
jgi:putative tryptophan/tyrosine transport system substrate-binding protein